MSIAILGIESSCDDTSAAIIEDAFILSNVISNQDVHRSYGGVVPELASRAHQQNIIPVVDHALKVADRSKGDIDAVAFTRGPGLLGSLLVGASFAKGLAMALDIPLIEVNHLQAHVLALFIKERGMEVIHPRFPFLCLLVSGGHTQLVVVRDFLEMETIGTTIDDAAGEAFDKCGKLIGLPYPAGPLVDKLALEGDPDAFRFSKPRTGTLDFSFSGLKTSFFYFIRDRLKEDPGFIEKNLAGLAASLQKTIVDILVEKVVEASRHTGIREIAVAGGVAANSGLRKALQHESRARDWDLYFPGFKYTTDNAAMVAITGYYKFLNRKFAGWDSAPVARLTI